LKKLSRIPCSSTVVTESRKAESGEAFLLEPLVILFRSNFSADLLKRICVMVLSGISAASGNPTET
jgi:hypothetical protein